MNLSANTKFDIMDVLPSLRLLLSKRVSVGRYGDGEFFLVQGRGIKFQRFDPGLSRSLREILQKPLPENFYAGLPPEVNLPEADRTELWRRAMPTDLISAIRKDRVYFPSAITRPERLPRTREFVQSYWELWRKIVDGRHVVLVQSDHNRTASQAKFLEGAAKISEILASDAHAYSNFHSILEKCKSHSKDSLFLISLGPTATVLSFELAGSGFQAIDTGHLWLFYEYHEANTRHTPLVRDDLQRDERKMEMQLGDTLVRAIPEIFSKTVLQEAENGDAVAVFRRSYVRHLKSIRKNFLDRMKLQWAEVELRNGLRMNLRLGDFISTEILSGEFESSTTRFIIENLPSEKVFVDIGANVGWFTLMVAKEMAERGGGRVVSFEPIPILYEKLKDSVWKSRLQGIVKIHNVALGDIDGTLEMGGDMHNLDKFMLNESNSTIFNVNVRRFDGFLRYFSSGIGMIKIDIEGAEHLWLQGAAESIKKCRPIIVSEINDTLLKRVSKVSAVEFIQAVADFGYEIALINRKGRASAPVTPAVAGAKNGRNIVFLPR